MDEGELEIIEGGFWKIYIWKFKNCTVFPFAWYGRYLFVCRSQGSQVSSQVSERVEKHRDKSSSEDGDLDRFLRWKVFLKSVVKDIYNW